MEQRGNVLVIGNSGVGKSTLINAVLGEEKAKTGWGTSGTTSKLEIYENDSIPFRIIDSIGFEPSLIKEHQAVNAVKKWSKQSAKEGHEDNNINVIWFCVDGTTSKLFPKTIKDLSAATAMWKTVPVIVVITKSYSEPEREQNIEMVHNAFANQKRAKNIKKVIPVVAATYTLNDTACAPPTGISELITMTNSLIPEGIRASERDIFSFNLIRRRVFAQSVVGASATAAVIVGAVPIPFADALILSPIEIGLVNGIAKIYGIDKGEDSKLFIDTIIEVGTVSAVAKAAISGLKAIPGVNLAAALLNAIIAGSIVTAIGEGSIYVFEKIYLGEKSVADIDWVKKVMESELSSQFVEKVTTIINKVSKSGNIKDVGAVIMQTFFGNKIAKK